MRDNPTRLSYWFPLVKAAGLPVPETVIIDLRESEQCKSIHTDEKQQAYLDYAARQIAERATAAGIFPPYFLRTDFTSGKHDWKRTCHVTDPDAINQHVYALWEFSECVDMLGLPTDVWVVRKMIKTAPLFRAFREMPIVREFRFFMRDGVIEHCQPYWPPKSIIGPSDAYWKLRLEAANQFLSLAEQHLLQELAQAASRAVPGFWSVDFLQGADGDWFLIDMAEGERSYRWDPHA